MPTTPATPVSPGSQFALTRWSMVLAAGDWRTESHSRRAMDELARTYWFPLYAFVRRKGHAPAAAEDLVQAFFTRLLEKDVLLAADPARGKFRSFLLASLKNFMANAWDKEQAQKRGAGQVFSLQAVDAEARYRAEPADHMTPERIFERRWALAVLDQVLCALRADYDSRGNAALFAALEPLLVAAAHPPYATLAAELGMSEDAVKVAAHRLRRRYRDLLRREIAQTVADPSLIDNEIRDLLSAL